jgi:hypothetical protein
MVMGQINLVHGEKYTINSEKSILLHGFIANFISFNGSWYFDFEDRPVSSLCKGASKSDLEISCFQVRPVRSAIWTRLLPYLPEIRRLPLGTGEDNKEEFL